MEEALICLEQDGLASLQIIFNIFRQKPITELFDLAVSVVDGDGCGSVPPVDPEGVQLRAETVEVTADAHDIRLVCGDALHVVVHTQQLYRQLSGQFLQKVYQ